MQTTNWYAYLLGESKVYSKKRKQYMYNVFVALVVTAVGTLIKYLIYHDISRLIGDVLTSVILVLGFPLSVLLIPFPYYIVGNKGLIYFSGQYIIYTPWENIDRGEEQHGKTPPSIRLKQVVVSMTVEEAVYRQQAAIVGGPSPNKPIEITDPKDTRTRIALPPSPSWQKTALGQDILRHVPHLA